jgi:hypothetical protein
MNPEERRSHLLRGGSLNRAWTFCLTENPASHCRVRSRSGETFANISKIARRNTLENKRPSFRCRGTKKNFKYQRFFILVTETNQQVNHDVEDSALVHERWASVSKIPPRGRNISAANTYMNHANTTLTRRTASDIDMGYHRSQFGRTTTD